MAPDPDTRRTAAELSIRLGRGVAIDARVTSAGLLSTATLVAGILLSTAVVVAAARRQRATPLPDPILISGPA